VAALPLRSANGVKDELGFGIGDAEAWFEGENPTAGFG
jgi:hypothetical protein